MSITLKITKVGRLFIVDDPKAPGSPMVGRGHTMMEAIGVWLVGHQDELGIAFDTTEVQATEARRRQRALKRR